MKSKFVKAGLLLMMFVIMTALSACGGGAGGESAGGNEDAGAETEAATVAEPNSGIGDIVYAIPDGWESSSVATGSYAEYKSGRSEYELYIRLTPEEVIKQVTYKDADGNDLKLESIQDYYEKIVVGDPDKLKKDNIAQEMVKVCGQDGAYNKRQDEKGKNLYGLSTAWIDGTTAYTIALIRRDNWGEGSKVKEDAVALTEDEVKMFESVIASVQKGDGDSFAAQNMKADSIGVFSIKTPENFVPISADEGMLQFEKKDNKNIGISIDRITEEDLKKFSFTVDDKPIETLSEYYSEFVSDGDVTNIAGYEAKVSKYPDEYDKYRHVSAAIVTDEAAYEINMGVNDMWDDEGNINEDAGELSEEDLATFDAFLEGITKK